MVWPLRYLRVVVIKGRVHAPGEVPPTVPPDRRRRPARHKGRRNTHLLQELRGAVFFFFVWRGSGEGGPHTVHAARPGR